MNDKADIDFISDQVKYLNSIKNKIQNVGAIILTKDDVDKLDKISQTLTSLKFFLVSEAFQKNTIDKAS